MEKSINKVELVGYAGINPEVKTFSNGTKMVRLALATSENFKNRDGEWVRNTTWHNVVLWDKVAEDALSKSKKGNLISISGKIVARSYVDNNGIKQHNVEIRGAGFEIKPREEKNLAA